jgi:golgi-specific brefeldin A-resistance guanine nucleotide exchange factor 1
VAENMKNILLVMQSGGYLAPPSEKPDQAELWNETWKRLNRFLPNLYKELYPDEAEVPVGSVPAKAKVPESAEKTGDSSDVVVKEAPGGEESDGEGDVKTEVGTFVRS